jgi:hypothetical protein
MSLGVSDVALEAPLPEDTGDLLAHYDRCVRGVLPPKSAAVRFVVNGYPNSTHSCNVGVLRGCDPGRVPSIFELRRRPFHRTGPFTVVHVVPTGIGAEIGGHSGDAGPAARLLGAACDRLILHPNVVNASDINGMPENAWYVEGSTIARLLMGTVGLLRPRVNRVGVVIVEPPGQPLLADDAINGASAACAAAGVAVSVIFRVLDGVRLRADFAPDGRASGEVTRLETLLLPLVQNRDKYDALAISSPVDFTSDVPDTYYTAGEKAVNPWGGIEALLTHAVTLLLGVPAAHSPLIECFRGRGLVEPTKAAEVVSCVDLFCVLKGLEKSPSLVPNPSFDDPSVLTAADVDCLVLPERCLGLPTLGALAQGIPVIVVRDRHNLLHNDLRHLPWRSGQCHFVENYLEAVGLLTALRAGIAVEALRRPLLRPEICVVGSTLQASDVGIEPSAGRT